MRLSKKIWWKRAEITFGIFRIYLGLIDRVKLNQAIQYDIESVRVPKERIALYTKRKYKGTDDIALVKTKITVVFNLGKIMPVSFQSVEPNCDPLMNNVLKICLGKVKDDDVSAYVSGFGASGETEEDKVICWTNRKGPNMYQM